MKKGFIKLHRSILDKGWYCKPDYLSIWIFILLEATHKPKEIWFAGENKILRPGEFVTGRKAISKITGVQESKVERILNYFEKKERQIEQLKKPQGRLISIINWGRFQKTEQQLNNNWTTTEQQLNTNKNIKNIKNDKKYNMAREIIKYLNEKTKKEFKPVKSNIEKITARLNDGYTREDFIKVIDTKCAGWIGTDFEKFLCPSTLFRPGKFDSYLNEKPRNFSSPQLAAGENSEKAEDRPRRERRLLQIIQIMKSFDFDFWTAEYLRNLTPETLQKEEKNIDKFCDALDKPTAARMRLWLQGIAEKEE